MPSQSKNLAVSVRNVSKVYRIGQNQPKYQTFQETLVSRLRNPLQKPSMEEFWALSDVSFDIERGDVVGVVGRNGAGKSTLLKVLSRITRPSKGEVHLMGRVGSLLEVGTGFHPELTGRENVYLNGAILGMKRHEIEKRFDSIVEFAEIAKFLDTPVKRYSSGMYVRLAFAVAAHLDPEILIVDEVLAVGDAAFQKKCLGTMQGIADSGRTILFVSHNMGAVSALCNKAAFMQQGKLMQYGPTADILESYMAATLQTGIESLRDRTDRDGSGATRLTHMYFRSSEGNIVDTLMSGCDCELIFAYEGKRKLKNPTFRWTIYNRNGQALVHVDNTLVEDLQGELPAQGEVGCRLRRLPLSPGLYRINVSVADSTGQLDYVQSAFTFHVEAGDFFGTGRSVNTIQDVCLMDQEWSLLPQTSTVAEPVSSR